jgi:branched-chain amino acid transport system substrate-binding protein
VAAGTGVADRFSSLRMRLGPPIKSLVSARVESTEESVHDMRYNKSAPRAVITAFCLIALLVAAGCGSSNSDSKGSTGSSAGSSTAAAGAPKSTVSGTPIVVGSICTCTSPTTQGSLGPSDKIIKAWASYTNAKGGLNGHPVKVITEDDGGDPAKSLAAAKKLVETDKVMAIVGEQSLQDGAWQKYVEGKGVPVVGGIPLEVPMFTSADFYPSGAGIPMFLYGVVDTAAKAGKKKLGLYYCAESPVCASLLPILTAMGKLKGVDVVGAKLSSTAPSYAAPCLSFKGKGVDALFIGLSSTLNPTIIKACTQQGFKPLNIAGSGTTAKVWLKDPNLSGTQISGTQAVYTDTNVPGVKTFIDALDQYVPGLTGSSQFSYPLLGPWSGGMLFSAAAKAGKLTPTSTPADVKAALYTLKDETLDGIAPPLNYTKGKPAFVPCYFAGQIADNAFKTVGDGQPICADAATQGKIGAALGG